MRMQMKSFVLLALSFVVAGALHGQDTRPSPTQTKAEIIAGSVNLEIKYGSPAVKGRKIWGDLVPYGEVWRTGANEATTFEVSRDVLVNGMRLPKGKYALFTIPAEKSWTLVFNREPDQWGAYNYKESMDALRVNTTPKKAKTFSERLEFVITPKGKVFLNWENLSVPFVVKPL
jgi:hypothetical protein